MEIGVKYFRWHAILWLYIFIALLFAAVSFLLFKKNKLNNGFTQKIYLVVFSIFLSVYLGEIVLRISGIGRMYSEEREGVFVNPAERMQKTWYMVRRPNEVISLKAAEYSFERKTNSEGLSDIEWNLEKDTNEIRLLTLGDSFTEGDGCDFDSSYPKVLSTLLQKEFPNLKVNVMNAGASGSDPWFEYKKFNDLLLKYKPDIVLYTNGSNDMLFDHLNYGGFERFAADSTVKNKVPKHKWLGLYEVSYMFRLLINFAGYDNTLFSARDRKLNEKTSMTDAKELSYKFSELAKANNFICFQLIRPDKNEMMTGRYVFDLNNLIKKNDSLSNYYTIDLLAYYRDSLKINRTNTDDFFWKIDQHHNAKGYAIMAQAVNSYLKQKISTVKRF